MPPIFDKTKCVKCRKCIVCCPGYILEMGEETPEVKYPDECWHCGCCRINCEQKDCISFDFPLHTRL